MTLQQFSFKALYFLIALSLLSATHPQGVYLRLVAVVCISVILLFQKIRQSDISPTFIYIVCFSVSYAIFLLVNGVAGSLTELLVTLISPACFYLSARHLVQNSEKPQHLEKTILVLISSFALLTYIRTFHSISEIGLVNTSRILIFGNKGETLSATLYGLNVAFGLAGLSIFIFHKNSRCRFFYLLPFLVSLLLVIHLVNRTGVAIIIITFLSCALYSRKGSLNFQIIFLIAFTILCVIWIIENAEISAAYASRADSVSSGGGRQQIWEESLKCLIKYPGGWINEADAIQRYAHNLWLDIARRTGCIPFTFISLATIIEMRKMYIQRHLDKESKYIWLFAFNCTFIIASMVEPVIEAIPSFFYLGIFFWGIQDSVIKKQLGMTS